MRLAAWCALLWTVVSAAAAAAGVSNPHNLGSCLNCHPTTPKFGIDTRRTVTFATTGDDPALCAGCHAPELNLHPMRVEAGSGPAGARRSDYLPSGAAGPLAGRVVCTSCHFIHAADGRHGLLRGFPGSPDPRHYVSWESFCNDCHGGNLAGRSPHDGGERSCVFCHPVRPRPGLTAEVMSRDRDLCRLCHAGVVESHYVRADPFRNERECSACHDPHARRDERPGLLSAAYLAAAAENVELHPHYSGALCFACHANTDDYALRNEDINALCDRCHASGRIAANIHPLRPVPATIKVPKGWPLAAGALTCLTCHEQGHEDQSPRRWMLRAGPVASPREVCPSCHAMSDLQKSRIHQEINENRSCELCHKVRPVPGRDRIGNVTFIAEPDLLCLRCHDVGAQDGSFHHGSVMGREIPEARLPDGLPLYRGRVICGTCHNPHLLGAVGMRLRRQTFQALSCLGCHAD